MKYRFDCERLYVYDKNINAYYYAGTFPGRTKKQAIREYRECLLVYE